MNASRLTIGEDVSYAGASMYLSFDSNSTISNAAYKTIEALNDSSMSAGALGNESSVLGESHQNSTLEPVDDNNLALTENRNERPPAKAPILKSFPKNILQEYKSFSSTPTKEQLLRSVDVLRGSEIEHEMNLEYLGMPVSKNVSSFKEENKENAQPECEVSALSSFGEVLTTVIEKKSLVQSVATDKSPQMVVVGEMELNSSKQETPSTLELEKKDRSKTNSKKKSGIPQIRRQSLFPSKPPVVSHTTVNAQPEELVKKEIESIPKLLNKMLHISTEVENTNKESAAAVVITEKRKTKTTGRTSLLPQAAKRPFSFTQRMSIVVKTTLNSPARKVARKSILPPGRQFSGILQTRKSVAASTAAPAADGSGRLGRRGIMMPTASRRSMLPTSIAADKVTARKTPPEPSIITTTTSANMQETLSSQKNTNKSNNATNMLKSKLNTIFNCNICLREFRVKSLFDAHMYSHDVMFPAAAAVTLKKPPLPAKSNTTNIPSTQCKYCDKKFAILHALHIHLLEKCTKIPPGEKKKLQFTELEHVGKAQLPPVFTHSSASVASSSSSIKSVSQYSQSSTNSIHSSAEKKESNVSPKDVVLKNTQEQPAAAKLKKAAAHSGVYQTPNKVVPCNICKQTFKSILDYTNHSMLMHSTHAAPKTAK